MKSIILTAAAIMLLEARENPFFPSNQNQTTPVSSNVLEEKPRLQTLHYQLPDQARVLKEVTLTYQNIDGSIETKNISVEKGIDWHHPIVIGQSPSSGAPATANTSKASKADFGFIRFDTNQKTLSIRGNAPLLRHFALTSPNRIIIDFKHTEPFKTQNIELNAAPYQSVQVTYHKDFSRATIYLDGRYRYTFENNNGVQQIICR